MKKTIRKIIEKILTACAKAVLWRHHPQIVAITGSAGKTTTKAAVGSVLTEGLKPKSVLIGYGNLGTVSGIPLAILNFRVNLLDAGVMAPLYLILLTILSVLKASWLVLWPSYFGYIVLELTADLPGDLQITSSYLKPNVSIVTNVGPSHLEYFQTISGVAKEKSSIVKNVRKDGLIILNGLDENVLSMRDLTSAKSKIINVESYEFASKAAEAVGKYYGLSPKDIQDGLDKAISPKSRFDILKGIGETTLIDSTYNSNPVSVRSSLAKLEDIVKDGQRKIIVFGDMLELGPDSKEYHRQSGQEVRKVADYLVTIGPLSSGIPADFKAKTIDQIYEDLINYIHPGDIILVKASHGVGLYSLVEKLKG